MPTKQGADGGRGHPITELEQLALDAAGAPAWILASQPEDQLLQLCRVWRSTPAGSLAEGSPAPAHQFAVPTQQGRRREKQAAFRQVATEGGQDQAIALGQFRTLDLASEDGQLVAQGQQLEFVLLLRSAAHNDQADQQAQAGVDGGVEHGGRR